MFECECGVKLTNPKLPVYCRCGRVHYPDKTIQPGEQPTPAWVNAIRRLRRDSDKGVGDTVQRVASWFGGERFKAFAARLGIPCGCSARQEEWNERWPYEKSPVAS